MPELCIVLVAAILNTAVVHAPAISAMNPADGSEIVPCSACHTCDKPSLDRLCLRSCTRKMMEQQALATGPEGIILLDMLDDVAEGLDRFGPVPFDHAGHARMAEMGGGCSACHHFTPEGEPHPECRSCHEPTVKRGDMTKPSLKGAYHRQCLNCHREWSHQTQCDICHLPRVGEKTAQTVEFVPTKDDIIGLMHPPIPEPDTEIYQTQLTTPSETKVIFRHKEHVHRFGLKCAECHHGDSCTRCHEEGRQHEQRKRTLQDHHRPCSACHDIDMREGGHCSRCHWREGETPPPPFEHVTTGWTLSRYHTELSCRACHTTVPFAKLNRDCSTCHAGWNPETFDHAVTGQVLDDNHASTECAECHVARKFDTAPACDECHEEDEGISFPAKRPGAVIPQKDEPAANRNAEYQVPDPTESADTAQREP